MIETKLWSTWAGVGISTSQPHLCCIKNNVNCTDSIFRGLEALYREEILHRIISLLGSGLIEWDTGLYSHVKSTPFKTWSILENGQNGWMKPVQWSVNEKNIQFCSKLAIPAVTWFLVIQEAEKSKEARKWCRDVTVIASLSNYTASLSINRKLHSSNWQEKKNRPQFVQNWFRYPIHATFFYSGFCIQLLHAQVFVCSL